MNRKFTADYIFNGYELSNNSSVLITDPNGLILDIVSTQDAGDNIQHFRGLLCPGFINTHCHLELSHLVNKIPPGTGLVDFVQQIMLNRNATAETKEIAMQLAYNEMLQSGIVAVGDICNTADSYAIKQQTGIFWHNFIEVSGFIDSAADKRIQEMARIRAIFSNNETSVNNSIAYPVSYAAHAPYSVSKTLFSRINLLTDRQITSIHNQETPAEDELYRNKTGKFLELYENFGIDIHSFSPTQLSSFLTWVPYFNKQQTIISVHNTFIHENDFNCLQEENAPDVFFCICINANKYIEEATPPILLLRDKKCKIVIGTDSYASNWQLNILAEIKRIQQETKQLIPTAELLQWATLNGANALRISKRYGSFEIGKQPGIVWINETINGEISQDSVSKLIL